MKKCIVILSGLFASMVWAKPITSFDQAVNKVETSVQKHGLTSLDIACLMFSEDEETDTFYRVEVREKHNQKCGGDPMFAPRLFSYQVQKQDGSLCTDSIIYAERLNAEDPTDFSCRKID